MHRTLKAETASPPEANRRAQQRSFDRFRHEYNQLRPHEALAMQTPATVYVPSPRRFPARVPEPEYGSALAVRKVRPCGNVTWGGEDVFLSKVLEGERIGLLPIDDRYFTIYFAKFPLGCFDSRRLRVVPLPRPQTCVRPRAEELVMDGVQGKGARPPSPALHPPNQCGTESVMSPV